MTMSKDEKKIMYDSLIKGYEYQMNEYTRYVESGCLSLADEALKDIERIKRRIRILVGEQQWWEFWK